MGKLLSTFLLLISITPVGFAQVYLDPNAPIDERVEDLLSLMTLQEKIGQMTQAERGNVEASDMEDIKTYFLGSVLSGGGSVPSPNTIESWVTMYNSMQNKALSTRLGIPILYGVDAVHGHNNLKGSVIFPHNIGLGCTRNPELVQACARITALEVRATGVDWTFSPCLTVPQNEFWGRTYEGFGESPSLVDSMASAAVLGYQTGMLGTQNSILACAKHFIGDGGTTNGHDQGNTQIDEEELRNIHLVPYLSAIDAGVGSVMASFNSWNGMKCHGNKALLTDLLKTELGFKGFVVSDWNGINQVDSDFKSAIEKSVNAGIDMAMQPNNYISFFNNLTQLVNEGSVSMDRIDDAVRRILTVKFQMGLFENHQANATLKDTVGCASHRQTARQAVRESLVLLKNDGILPLSKQPGKILVAGSKANDIGALCGGWTITWQGSLGAITEGTTIYEAVAQTIGSQNTLLTTSAFQIPDANVAIVVVGERPYAEGVGDISSEAWFELSNEDANIVQAVKNKGIPLVVVLLSGRPLDIRTQLSESNAFLVAWLPGTEGGSGIADVIFRDYPPTGKLSHTWPASYFDVPINLLSNNDGKEALFPYGFGLNYFDVSAPDKLGEKEKIRIYPNPATDYIIVESALFSDAKISVSDCMGRTVYVHTMDGCKKVIPLKGFEIGVYSITVQSNNGAVTQKVILE